MKDVKKGAFLVGVAARLLPLVMLCTVPACAQTPVETGPVVHRPAADIVVHPFDGAFPLFDNGAATAILVDPAEDAGVLRAVRNLQADLEKRGGARPEVRTAIPGDTANLIIVGELGKSRWVSQLPRSGAHQRGRGCARMGGVLAGSDRSAVRRG